MIRRICYLYITMEEEITIENAIDHIEKLNDAIRRDAMRLDKDARSMAISLIAAVMAVTAEDLKNFQSSHEASGDSSPISEGQRSRIRAIISEATGKKAS